tara:strand:- start:93 stop:209 length:117 start_codon:yes stop_codon:yes gene_type:complete
MVFDINSLKAMITKDECNFRKLESILKSTLMAEKLKEK